MTDPDRKATEDERLNELLKEINAPKQVYLKLTSTVRNINETANEVIETSTRVFTKMR